jgi:hypothetical protein
MFLILYGRSESIVVVGGIENNAKIYDNLVGFLSALLVCGFVVQNVNVT